MCPEGKWCFAQEELDSRVPLATATATNPTCASRGRSILRARIIIRDWNETLPLPLWLTASTLQGRLKRQG